MCPTLVPGTAHKYHRRHQRWLTMHPEQMKLPSCIHQDFRKYWMKQPNFISQALFQKAFIGSIARRHTGTTLPNRYARRWRKPISMPNVRTAHYHSDLFVSAKEIPDKPWFKNRVIIDKPILLSVSLSPFLMNTINY